MTVDDVDELVQRADVDGLRALASSSDAKIAKAARKGLHRLRSQGIAAAAEEVRPPRQPVPVSPTLDELPSLATSHDGAGEQVVWLIRPTLGDAEVFQARIHEVHGLVQFDAARWSRRQIRQLRDDVLGMIDIPAAEVPTDWAHWLIEEAYERTLAARRTPPPGFARARANLGVAPRRFAEHPAKTEIQPSADVGEPEAAKLFESPCCASWYPEREHLERLALLLEEAETSPLVLGEAQKSDRRRTIARRVVAEYFTAERRARYARRLLDAAYTVHRADRRDRELAPLLRGMADSLGDLARDVETHPLAMGLFLRCFRPDPEAKPPEEPSRLVSPADQSILRPPLPRERRRRS